MKKIPKKHANTVFTFYATMMMGLIMSSVLTILNTGIDSGLPLRIFHAYLIAWPVAFVSLFCVRPLVVKLTEKTVA